MAALSTCSGGGQAQAELLLDVGLEVGWQRQVVGAQRVRYAAADRGRLLGGVLDRRGEVQQVPQGAVVGDIGLHEHGDGLGVAAEALGQEDDVGLALGAVGQEVGGVELGSELRCQRPEEQRQHAGGHQDHRGLADGGVADGPHQVPRAGDGLVDGPELRLLALGFAAAVENDARRGHPGEEHEEPAHHPDGGDHAEVGEPGDVTDQVGEEAHDGGHPGQAQRQHHARHRFGDPRRRVRALGSDLAVAGRALDAVVDAQADQHHRHHLAQHAGSADGSEPVGAEQALEAEGPHDGEDQADHAQDHVADLSVEQRQQHRDHCEGDRHQQHQRGAARLVGLLVVLARRHGAGRVEFAEGNRLHRVVDSELRGG